jgi:hypothetical protein
MGRRAKASVTCGVVTGWLRFWPGNGVATLLVRTGRGREVDFYAPREQVDRVQQAVKGHVVEVTKWDDHVVLFDRSTGRQYRLDVPAGNQIPDGDVVNQEFV